MIQLLRISALKASYGYKSHSPIYEQIADGTHPKGVLIGGRAKAWPNFEVQAIVAARIRGDSPEQMRALVAQMHISRQTAGRVQS